MEEQELAERCRQGDNLAAKNCMSAMRDACSAYASVMQVTGRLPQDLMHDGFLKLF